MTNLLCMLAGILVVIGLLALIATMLARGMALFLQHYGLSDVWSLVPLVIGIILATASVLSWNPLISGIKP